LDAGAYCWVSLSGLRLPVLLVERFFEDRVGVREGFLEGTTRWPEGLQVGRGSEGCLEGAKTDGRGDGMDLGRWEGLCASGAVVRDVGTALQDTDGNADADNDGFDVGAALGDTDGTADGSDDGLHVGTTLGDMGESTEGNETGNCVKTAAGKP
jgi:hypothetical protein